MTFGKQTVVKIFGGKMRFRLESNTTPDEYQVKLDGIVKRSQDMSPVFVEISKMIMESTRKNFESQGRPRRWPPLKPSTIADRVRQGYQPGPILDRSGALKSSLTNPNDSNAIIRIRPRSLQMATRDKKYSIHQRGTRTIPQRVMMRLQRAEKRRIGRMVRTWIFDAEARQTS